MAVREPTAIQTMVQSASLAALGTLAASTIACSQPARFAASPITEGPVSSDINQGDPSRKALESFNQGHESRVDILIVNDNSVSMEVEQRKLGERFQSFVSAVQHADYQIAMTTTDLDSPKHGLNGRIMTWDGLGSKILTKDTPLASSIFQRTVQRSETLNCDRLSADDCPSGDEQPMRALIRAFEQRHSANQGFFRDGADLIVLVLSDEDEKSSGAGRTTQPKEVIDSFNAAFGGGKKFQAYGIVIKPGDEACRREQQAQQGNTGQGYFGTHVDALARLTGGKTFSICEQDYANPLAEMSRDFARLSGTFELHKAPKRNQVTVRLFPEAKIAYKVVGKKVVFDVPPPAGSRIEIEYEPMD